MWSGPWVLAFHCTPFVSPSSLVGVCWESEIPFCDNSIVFFTVMFQNNCFRKSPLLLSGKDVLSPRCCPAPAVPRTKQFHPFGSLPKGAGWLRGAWGPQEGRGARAAGREGGKRRPPVASARLLSAAARTRPPSFFPLL